MGPIFSRGTIMVMPTGNLLLRGDETHSWIADGDARDVHVVINMGTIEVMQDAHLVVDGKGINVGEFDIGGMVQFGGAIEADVLFAYASSKLRNMVPPFAAPDVDQVASEGGLSIFATGVVSGIAILRGDVTSKGKIDPGLPGSHGTIQIYGSLFSEGTLAFDIIEPASIGQFPDHDIIDVLGKVDISGEVRVTFDRGYVPDTALEVGLVRSNANKLAAAAATNYAVFTDNPIVDFIVDQYIDNRQLNSKPRTVLFLRLTPKTAPPSTSRPTRSWRHH